MSCVTRGEEKAEVLSGYGKNENYYIHCSLPLNSLHKIWRNLGEMHIAADVCCVSCMLLQMKPHA